MIRRRLSQYRTAADRYSLITSSKLNRIIHQFYISKYSLQSDKNHDDSVKMAGTQTIMK